MSGHQGLFQSSPGREAGRYACLANSRYWLARFQSSPGREAGRYAIHQNGRAVERAVSILARP